MKNYFTGCTTLQAAKERQLRCIRPKLNQGNTERQAPQDRTRKPAT